MLSTRQCDAIESDKQRGATHMLGNILRGWNEMSTYRKIRRVFMIGLAVFGLWALTPYLYNRRVDESFPVAAPASQAVVLATAAPAMADKAAPTAAMADNTVMDNKAAPTAAMADKAAPTAAMADTAALDNKTAPTA